MAATQILQSCFGKMEKRFKRKEMVIWLMLVVLWIVREITL